jgi:hypothetical protein
MVVAALCCGDVFLREVQGKMNAARYREILDENLVQSTQDFRLGQRFTFQQDNDPKNTAKTTQECLRDKSLNVLDLKIAVHLTLPIQLDRA